MFVNICTLPPGHSMAVIAFLLANSVFLLINSYVNGNLVLENALLPWEVTVFLFALSVLLNLIFLFSVHAKYTKFMFTIVYFH